MIRPCRDQLSGPVEVIFIDVAGKTHRTYRRRIETRIFVAIAYARKESGAGRIRLARVPDCSSASLHSFVQGAIRPGSVVRTGGRDKDFKLEAEGYHHEVNNLREPHSKFLPAAHLAFQQFNRWLFGTYEGAVSSKHLAYYLDEFAFRFNNHRSRFGGEVFYHLLQQAVSVEPSPYKDLVGGTSNSGAPRDLGLLRPNEFSRRANGNKNARAVAPGNNQGLPYLSGA